jgi:hypothetical protein
MAGQITAEVIGKAPGDDLPYAYDFLEWALLLTDPLVSGTVTALPTPGLTIGPVTPSGTQLRCTISGGTAPIVYRLTITGITAAGRRVVGYVDLYVNEPESAEV